MDEQRFDRLARAFAQPRTRRWTLGAIVASLGITTRVNPARAYGCLIGLECCGPGCMTPEYSELPGTCYDPDEQFCFNFERGITCSNNYKVCTDNGREVCVPPDQRCCPVGRVCGPTACCVEVESCLRRYDTQEFICYRPCNIDQLPCGYECCGGNQLCVNERCVEPTDPPDPCEAGRAGPGTANAGDCCLPPHTKCGDRCCTGDQTCCGGGAHTTCCERGKTCCPGANGVACCDAAETFCCSGVCCANHWTCVGGECRENCLNDRTNCGRNCCTKDQICFDPLQDICSDRCPQGQTACGDRECCLSSQQCKNGTCVQKCSNGQKECGKTCCGQSQQCKEGQCVKKKRANKRRKRK